MTSTWREERRRRITCQRSHGEHYFDTIAKNAIFEFRYEIAGWPKRVESRDALMALYRGYGHCGPSQEQS
jgi:hypothetical protein